MNAFYTYSLIHILPSPEEISNIVTGGIVTLNVELSQANDIISH